MSSFGDNLHTKNLTCEKINGVAYVPGTDSTPNLQLVCNVDPKGSTTTGIECNNLILGKNSTFAATDRICAVNPTTMAPATYVFVFTNVANAAEKII